MKRLSIQEKTEASFIAGKALLMESMVHKDGLSTDDALIMDGHKLSDYIRYTEFLFNLSHRDNHKVYDMTEKQIFKTYIN